MRTLAQSPTAHLARLPDSWIAGLFLLTVVMTTGAPAQAADPNLEWRTFRTEHFSIHFHQGGQAFAHRVAAVSEDAYAELSEHLGWDAGEDRIHVVCTDLVDGANGFAQVYPYDRITIHAFAPEADTDLGRYDDWLRILIFHELTHVLHLNQVGGLAAVVNGVLGKTLLPNLALPRWFLEGLATYMEARRDGVGRVGSAHAQMHIRSALLEGTLPDTIGGLTGSPMIRPGASLEYSFGGAFVAWLVERFGEDKLLGFVQRYGQRLVPYGLNSVARGTYGVDFEALYQTWRQEALQRARDWASEERRQGLRVGTRLTVEGHQHHAPSFGPDGQIAVVKSNGYERSQLWTGTLELDVDSPRLLLEPRLPCHGGCGRAVWSLADGDLYVIAYRWFGAHRLFRGLVRVIGGHSSARTVSVTQGVRVREPDIRADGRRALLVTADWGKTALVEVALSGHGPDRVLVEYEAGFQLNQPRYLSDGARVAFSGQGEDGLRDIYLREENGDLRRLTHDADREISLTVSPDGRTLFFVSDTENVWNIHAMDIQSGRRWQVTRVLGGAFNPSVSPDGQWLLYSGYHAGGFDLFLLPLKRSEWEERSAGTAPISRAYRPTPVLVESMPYRAGAALWPRAWEPSFSMDQTGGGNAAIQLSGQDPLGEHRWALIGSLDLGTHKPSVIGSYSWSGARPTVSTLWAWVPTSGLRRVTDQWEIFDEENLFGSVEVSTSLPHVEWPFQLSGGLDYWGSFDPERPDRFTYDPGSSVPIVSEDEHRFSLTLGWSFDHVEEYTHSISPERGAQASMRFSLSPTWLGNDADTWRLNWRGDVYIPMPWWHSHVLAFKAKGGLSGGDSDARTSFSVGGFPQQNIAQDLLAQAGLGGTYLRGYPPGAFEGETYYFLSAEYRLPILDIFQAPGTLPVWFKRLSGAVYSDLALIYDDVPAGEDFIASVGAELWLSTEFFYKFPFLFRLGFAQGLSDPMPQQLYFVMGSNY